IKYGPINSGPMSVLHAILTHDNPNLSKTQPEEHDCIHTIHTHTSPRLDLMDTPQPGSEDVFVDGSCSRPVDGQYQTGYAVVQLPDKVLEASSIPHMSAQAAELVALTRACTLFTNKDVNIYTDSRYAHGVVHDFGMIWKQRGFIAADGKGISHKTLIEDLLHALQLPRTVSIIHCRAHTQGRDDISLGNALADRIAKEVASQTIYYRMIFSIFSPPKCPEEQLLQELQGFATHEDIAYWKKQGLEKDQNGLYSKEGKIGIPESSAPIFISQAHGVGHKGLKVTLGLIQQHFVILNLSLHCQVYLQRCVQCLQTNTTVTHKARHEHLPPPTGPFTHLQVDFTHIPKTGKRQQYLLVIVDHFLKWPEAFVTNKEDARTVVKILTTEIIPRYGCPLQINSDNGPAFASKVTQELAKWLQVTWKFNVPYHPQSSGIVERMNRTIKEKLMKATDGTWVHWQTYLPAILAEIRMTPSRTTKLSPFEILMGRPFPTPWVKGRFVIMPGDLDLIQEEYVKQLIFKLNSVYGDVSVQFPLPSQEPTHPYQPGDLVCIRQLNKSRKGKFPFGPPTTVIAVTRTAVLTDSQDIWIHASRLKPCPKR
ncbi:Retrovirus-related Pol poly from transposon opus, partial [Pelobates cultripes]